ncbi:MAG TPA: VWA domain-containing protein [Xanthobacteraceae bacterium]|nr:VWA domain-containing protein [Xanthobacteraceae bacterium]
MSDVARHLAPFLTFAALLRRSGFAVAPEQMMAWLAAIELLGPTGIADVRRAARATLAPPPERFDEFDALFDAHFLGALSAGLESAPREEEAPRAADDSAGGPEPIFGDETRESGAKATGAERLSARRFAPASEDATLRRFARALPARAPRRRGYRWRTARGGPSTDARRMFRDAMRNAGEFVRMRRRKRRLRQRRIIVLIDVSGSMKERTQAHLAFAHTLVGAADAVEVFTIGTRLTRVTSALRLKNRERALTAASLLVADWDGGTRLGEALGAFLAVPRFAALARGAALVVLSDGLERGDPRAMRDAVERFARIAWRIVWLTPLAADAAFEPRTAGLLAARPFLNELGDGASIDSICAHVLDLAKARAA